MENPFKRTVASAALKVDSGTLRPLSEHLTSQEQQSLTTATPEETSIFRSDVSGVTPHSGEVGEPAASTSIFRTDRAVPLAAAVQAHARAVIRAKRGIARNVLAIGEHLTAVKALYADSPRTFTKWCHSTVAITARSVRNYIAVYERFGKTETVSKFDDGALILLASPSCPPKAVDAAVKLSSSQRVAQKDAKRIIQKHTIDEAKPAKPRKLTLTTTIGTVTILADDRDATPAEVLTAIVKKLQAMRKVA